MFKHVISILLSPTCIKREVFIRDFIILKMDSDNATSASLSTPSVSPANSPPFDVVEPWMESTLEKFHKRKHRLHGDLWVIVEVFRNTVCIHVRELKDGWRNEAGVTMNISEFFWLTRKEMPSSATFGRINVAKQKTGTLLRRADIRIGGEPSKARRILITNQGFATLMREKKSISEDIKDASAFANFRNKQEGQNLELFQGILVVLASKIYASRSRAACSACSGLTDQGNLMSHNCLEETKDDKLKRAKESLDDVPDSALQCVLVSNNLPLSKQHCSCIISNNREVLAKKVANYNLTPEAQECFDTYFNANADFIMTDTPDWGVEQ